MAGLRPTRAPLGALLIVTLAAGGCELAGAGDAFEPPRRTARADLRIGSVDDPATMLTTFRELIVGPHDRIYTIHPQESQIRVHDADGRPVRTIGREGEGPGEFRSPGNIGFLGDTLWVFDYGTYRFTFFDAEGELLESRAFPVDLGDRERTPPRPSGLLSDGTVWGNSPMWSQEVAAGTLTHQTDVRLDTAGAIVDTLIRFPVANTTWELHDPSSPNGLRTYRPQPFSAAPIVAISEDRPEIMIVERPIAADPARGEFHVTKLGLDGDTVFSHAFAYTPITLPATLPDSHARAFATPPAGLPPRMAAGFPAPARALELARSTLFAPDYYPPVTSAVPGRDGSIWLRREDAGGDQREWWILDESGRMVGAVFLPAGFRVMAAERDQVWGLETDDLDVPYIVRYVVESE